MRAVKRLGPAWDPETRRFSRVPIQTKNGTISSFLLHSLVPFTVTIPVTNREMSKAVESRDASLVFAEHTFEDK